MENDNGRYPEDFLDVYTLWLTRWRSRWKRLELGCGSRDETLRVACSVPKSRVLLIRKLEWLNDPWSSQRKRQPYGCHFNVIQTWPTHLREVWFSRKFRPVGDYKIRWNPMTASDEPPPLTEGHIHINEEVEGKKALQKHRHSFAPLARPTQRDEKQRQIRT